IAESDVINWTEPQEVQRLSERCWISQAAKSAHAIEWEFPGRNFAPGGQIDPAFGHSARAKDGRARIVTSQRQLQIVRTALALAARDHDDIGAHQGCQRLAQASQRENLAAAERSQRVNQHDVHLALEAGMLKAVVEDQHVGAEALLE